MVLYADNNMEKFFPEEKKARIDANFKLFDRDNNDHINLSELKELLVSLNYYFPEDELEELY